MTAKIEVIKRLEIFEVTTIIQQDDNILWLMDNDSKRKLRFTEKPNYAFPRSDYNHFPIILNKDGSLWSHANRFLLCKLKAIKRPAYKTLEAISIDLQNFQRWLAIENVDYLKIYETCFCKTNLSILCLLA